MGEVLQTLSGIFNIWIFLGIVLAVAWGLAVKLVPQNTAYIVERFGKYHKTMEAGFNVFVPFMDRIAYIRTLKEQAFNVPSQSSITRDNIALVVDAVLFIKVLDPVKASYGVDDYIFSVTQLSQTSIRSEIGRLSLIQTFEERDSLNVAIVSAINEAAVPWGVQVLRFEIKDINPPRSVLDAMERQMRSEREKCAVILESEGLRQSEINLADGRKQARLLTAEALKFELILKAEGEAMAIISVAQAQSEALEIIGRTAATEEGQKAIQLDLAEKAIEAKKVIARESTVVLLPDNQNSTACLVAEAMSIINTLNACKKKGDNHELLDGSSE